MILSWLRGLLLTRTGRIGGTIAGISIAVALTADLGTFIQSSAQSMTARAITSVPVDWQVELLPTANSDDIASAIAAASPVAHSENLGYAEVTGFEFTDSVGTQSTGSGVAVGLQPSYIQTLPAGFRMLTGDASGAVLLQQTAANLHAVPGDTIIIHRAGLADATSKISGIVDLKTADAFFQRIGVPAGAAAQAPPDNAVLLPLDEWHNIFDAQATSQPQSVRNQIHVVLDHGLLPTDPNSAYIAAVQAGHNFEVRVAGSALLSNNLAAQLDAARGDSLYARVLFLFLGAPGVILAALLTISIAGSGAQRRRRDQSLLRMRGASLGQILYLSAAEAMAVGLGGALIGILIATLTAPLFGQAVFAAGRLPWSMATGVGGIFLACVAVLLPAARTTRLLSVVETRQTINAEREPVWQRLYLDVVCLALAGIVFWQTAASGYQVVLATEGVTAVAVDYTAFLAPILTWIGAGLLTIRVVGYAVGKGSGFLVKLFPALSKGVGPAVVASMARQRRRLATGAAFAALAVGFAVSTGTFNSTYQSQARVDAILTNGSDVTVSGTSKAPAGDRIARLRALPGVVAAEPMQHRYAYVGTDLQDLYGIDPMRIGNATIMADAYFANHDTASTLNMLRDQPDAILVSEETVSDFQLAKGDIVNLRLQGPDNQYHVVPFRFAGVIREFPTAPRDSFIIANAAYVANATGVDSQEVVLLKTGGDLKAVHAGAFDIVKDMPGAQVRDVGEARQVIGSSLTAVDLGGLTFLELSFAVLLVVGATALVLALGLADRRRGFAILSVLGATQSQQAAFILTETALVLTGGFVFGVISGWSVTEILVTVLQGVFDPPPEALVVPWLYLAVVGATAFVITAGVVLNALRDTSVEPLRRLRELQ